jgi:hypothetical protein
MSVRIIQVLVQQTYRARMRVGARSIPVGKVCREMLWGGCIDLGTGWGRVSGQLHSSATLPSGKEPLIPI